MDKNISIEQYLNQPENKEIIAKKKSPVTSIIILTCGIALFVASVLLKEVSSGLVFPLTITLASIISIWGVFAFSFRKKKYYVSATGQEIKVKEYLFNIKDRDKLVRMVENSDFNGIEKLEKTAQDSLKLKIATTADHNYCLAQVVVFIPYEFVNATTPVKTPSDKAKTLFANI